MYRSVGSNWGIAREDVDACYDLLPRRMRCLRRGPSVLDPSLISHPLIYTHYLRVHVVGGFSKGELCRDTRARQPVDMSLHSASRESDVECIPD